MKLLPKTIQLLNKEKLLPIKSQVWHFGCGPEENSILKRIRGLNFPKNAFDDPYIEFTLGESFAPVPKSYLNSLAVSINSGLPQEYELIMQKFGPIHLPGESSISFFDQAVICSLLSVFEFKPFDSPILPIAVCDSDPNWFCLIRVDGNFTSKIYKIDHCIGSIENSSEVVSNSITEFIINIISQYKVSATYLKH